MNSKMVRSWPSQITKSKKEYFLKNLRVVLNDLLSKCEHIILLGEFNLSTTNKHLDEFMTFLI